jgi:hypothetical protein
VLAISLIFSGRFGLLIEKKVHSVADQEAKGDIIERSIALFGQFEPS